MPETLHRGTATLDGLDVTWNVKGDGLPSPVVDGIHYEVECFFLGPSSKAGTKPAQLHLEDFFELFYALQCFELAGNAREESPTVVHYYLERLRVALAKLEQSDPRFAYPHSLAVTAAQYAGELDVEAAMDFWTELEGALPFPLTRADQSGPYVVIDDLQSNEDFAETMLPSRDQLRIDLTHELDDEEFLVPGRMVFPRGVFDPVAFLSVDRLLKGGELTLSVSIDPPTPAAHAALRGLRRRLDAHFSHSQEIEVSLVEYYNHLAFSHHCLSLLQATHEARTDLKHRLILLTELDDSLSEARRRNPELGYARTLTGIAKEACDRLDIEASIMLTDAIRAWLPEDYRERFPANWDFARFPGVTDELLWGLTGEISDFVLVTPGAPGLGGPPCHVERVEPFLEAEDIAPSNCYLFALLDEGICA
ncbi:hypothetical protein [Corynebacterium sp. UBA2622]|uniref:hypothetical protein n=1 Tax=Corynebacterium sp. UBA2622 TaxID=1946393 RepID=UPI0025BDBC80|nr:hypothetical protein [Corynebacterium sp. UBA2622]